MKIQAVNPKTGQWETAEQIGKPYKTGYPPNVEWVAIVEFQDGQQVEQPTWVIKEQ